MTVRSSKHYEVVGWDIEDPVMDSDLRLDDFFNGGDSASLTEKDIDNAVRGEEYPLDDAFYLIVEGEEVDDLSDIDEAPDKVPVHVYDSEGGYVTTQESIDEVIRGAETQWSKLSEESGGLDFTKVSSMLHNKGELQASYNLGEKEERKGITYFGHEVNGNIAVYAHEADNPEKIKESDQIGIYEGVEELKAAFKNYQNIITDEDGRNIQLGDVRNDNFILGKGVSIREKR